MTIFKLVFYGFLMSRSLYSMQSSIVSQLLLPVLTPLVSGSRLWAANYVNTQVLQWFRGVGGYRIPIQAILSFQPTQPNDVTYATLGSYNAYVANRRYYKNQSLWYQSLSLSLSTRPIPQEISIALREINRWNKLLHGLLIVLPPDEVILISDDLTMQKTVVLLTCWLIYLGYELHEACRIAMYGRLNEGNLEERYAQLICRYFDYRRSLNCVQLWWDSDINWDEMWLSDGVDC